MSEAQPIDIERLTRAYHTVEPDLENEETLVSFGTSGHRGSPNRANFTERHVAAIAQSVADLRREEGVDGPLFMGIDTHALSEPAFMTAMEVFIANDVALEYQAGRGRTPTPSISHAILTHNKARARGLADGVLLTPSHNPPEDGGFKYNPTSGGPAEATLTGKIERLANGYLRAGNKGVKRVPFDKAIKKARARDFLTEYVEDLPTIIDMDKIASSSISIGVDPMGGAGLEYWKTIAERYRLNMTIVNDRIDPTFAFMPPDKDGVIRMDCSSESAMRELIALKDRFDIAFGNDPDFDRHGIVTPAEGLLNPNHYLAVAIGYLFETRKKWGKGKKVGKTLVSSAMIDRVAASLGVGLYETPVGFKWFVAGLLDGTLGFGGEESAGASFSRFDGSVFSSDKDGIIMNLLAAEILAATGSDPGQIYRAKFEEAFGASYYRRVDRPADGKMKKKLKEMRPESISLTELAGEKIEAIMTEAPGNKAPIGGVKVVAKNGWMAARPSGTEEIYKVYAESFIGPDHLDEIIAVADRLTR